MKKIDTYYLIDYENVNSDGFSGCEKLDKTDFIAIFFTQNAKMLDMSKISNRGNSSLELFEVPAGKQSADVHIISYLGYLIGKYENENQEKDFNVVIVSKDSDFDNVIKFWSSKNNVKISRRAHIKISPLIKKTPEKITNTEQNKTTTPLKDKTTVNSEIMKIISKAGYKSEIVAYVASTVVKNLGVKNGKQQTYRAIISKFGQSEGLAIYNQIKKSL